MCWCHRRCQASAGPVLQPMPDKRQPRTHKPTQIFASFGLRNTAASQTLAGANSIITRCLIFIKFRPPSLLEHNRRVEQRSSSLLALGLTQSTYRQRMGSESQRLAPLQGDAWKSRGKWGCAASAAFLKQRLSKCHEREPEPPLFP